MGPRPDGRGTLNGLIDLVAGDESVNGAAAGWPRNAYVQRAYPVYDVMQVGVQFVASLVDADDPASRAELDVHDVGRVPGAQSVELTLLFEDPAGTVHARTGTAGATDDADAANDNDIRWINTSDDRLLTEGPAGRWRLTAQAAWYSRAGGSADPLSTALYVVRSPSPAIFYTRGSAEA